MVLFYQLMSAGTSITCENSQMVVSLNSSYVADGHSSDVHLLDPSCTGQVFDNGTIQLVTDFDRCGTTMNVGSYKYSKLVFDHFLFNVAFVNRSHNWVLFLLGHMVGFVTLNSTSNCFQLE